MIKKRDLHECGQLFDLLSEPSVFPFVRHKATSAEEYLFMTKQVMEDEEQGLCISRTITDEYNQPIGTISLFDIQEGAGFLGTWIGSSFQGLGYNQKAKQLFLEELFFQHQIQTVFLRIKKENVKSRRAAEKLPYTVLANDTHQSLYDQINKDGDIYDLYQIPKDLFYMVSVQQSEETEEQAM